MSKFTAFPVKGDAFLLEREKYSILVDGGHSYSTASTLDTLYLKSTLPTYIVCTHYDADHVNGLILLLKRFCKNLQRANKTNESNTELWLTDYLGKNLEYIEKHINDLNELKRSTEKPKKRCEIQAAITRTQAYYNLLYYADQLGLNLRFFKHAPHNVSGGVNALFPINAKQVPPSIFVKYDFNTFCLLSIPNQKALAFIAPQSTHENAVLFCSDTDICCSDFKLIRNIPHDRDILVTAPHHGSKSNENSYFAIKAAFPKCEQLFVRGHYDRNIKIAPSFLHLSRKRKSCTAGCVKSANSTPCSHFCKFSNSALRKHVVLTENKFIGLANLSRLGKLLWAFSPSTRTP